MGNLRALNSIGISGVPAQLAPLHQALIYDMAYGKSPNGFTDTVLNIQLDSRV
jgi:hypothetical protein